MPGKLSQLRLNRLTMSRMALACPQCGTAVAAAHVTSATQVICPKCAAVLAIQPGLETGALDLVFSGQARRAGKSASPGAPAASASAGDQHHAQECRRRGMDLTRGKMFREAVAAFSEAIARDPAHAQTYNNRGYAWAACGEHERALADFNEAIRLAPGHAAGYTNRGLLHVKRGEFARALADLAEALRLDPGAAEQLAPAIAKARASLGRDAP
jgi:tetratricopeptide (TPR) repeat protein